MPLLLMPCRNIIHLTDDSLTHCAYLLSSLLCFFALMPLFLCIIYSLLWKKMTGMCSCKVVCNLTFERCTSPSSSSPPTPRIFRLLRRLIKSVWLCFFIRGGWGLDVMVHTPDKETEWDCVKRIISVTTPLSKADMSLQHILEEVSTSLQIIPLRTWLMQHSYITQVYTNTNTWSLPFKSDWKQEADVL